MRPIRSQPALFTMAQARERRLQELRPHGWRADLSSLIGGDWTSSKDAKKLSVQTMSDFEREIIKILTCAIPASDFYDEADSPLARAAYQQAATEFMSLERGFIGIEALKQACTSICSADPAALDVDLQEVVDSMHTMELEDHEQDYMLLAQEALAIREDPRFDSP